MLFLLHIILMSTASLGIVAGVSAAMFFRKKKYWLKFHKTINSFSFGGTATGMISAFAYVSTSSGKHIDGFHQLAGLTAFILASITMIAAFYQSKAKNKPAARKAHRWLGRLSLVSLLTAIILGLMLINII